MVIGVMGVSGAGKTTVGRRLAEVTGRAFLDADEVHLPSDLRAMAEGRPLDGEQRSAWIDRLGAEIRRRTSDGTDLVVACSALQTVHRRRLIELAGPIRWVNLVVPPAVLRRRLQERQDREGGVGPSLLESQLIDYEPPAADEGVIDVDADREVQLVVEDAASRLEPGPA